MNSQFGVSDKIALIFAIISVGSTESLEDADFILDNITTAIITTYSTRLRYHKLIFDLIGTGKVFKLDETRRYSRDGGYSECECECECECEGIMILPGYGTINLIMI